MSQTAGHAPGSTRLQRFSSSSSSSAHSTSTATSTSYVNEIRSSTSPTSSRSSSSVSTTSFKSSFNAPTVNIVVAPQIALKSFNSEIPATSPTSNNNNNNTKNIVNSNKSSSSKKSAAASKAKSTKMSAAVDVRSMTHSPSPMIEANNNLVDRKTGLPYHQKNVIGMKGMSAGTSPVNGTASSHVQVYKESSISLKPSTGQNDQVPQQGNLPQMYSVSLAFKTPKLHYSNQLYIYPYYVVTFCESAEAKLEADVTPSLERQIKYCNVFYFDFAQQQQQQQVVEQQQQPLQQQPEPEESEEEEEEWTEFYEEVHHTTVITETKTEAANAFYQQEQAAQQSVIYGENPALAGPNVGSGGGEGTLGISNSPSRLESQNHPPPLSIDGGASSNASSTAAAATAKSGGSKPSSAPSTTAADNGPSLADVISLDGVDRKSPKKSRHSQKGHSKGGGRK